jgi:hypothetical protein
MPPLLLAQRCRLHRLDRCNLALEPVHDLQRLVPAAFQLTGDQAIVGIDGVILPAGIPAEKRACCSARSSCLWAADVSLV